MPSGPSQLAEYLRRQADRPHEPGSFRSVVAGRHRYAPGAARATHGAIGAGGGRRGVDRRRVAVDPITKQPRAHSARRRTSPPRAALPAPPIGTARTALPVAGDSTEALPMAPAKSREIDACARAYRRTEDRTARPDRRAARSAQEASNSARPRPPTAKISLRLPPAAETVPSPIGPLPQGKDVSPPEQTAPVEREAPVRKKARPARASQHPPRPASATSTRRCRRRSNSARIRLVPVPKGPLAVPLQPPGNDRCAAPVAGDPDLQREGTTSPS